MRKDDAVNLLSTEARQGDTQVNDHPARCVECGRVSHVEQAVGESRIGGNRAHNHLERVVWILQNLLHLDDNLRKGGKLNCAGFDGGQHAAQKLDGCALFYSMVLRPHLQRTLAASPRVSIIVR